VSVDFAEGEQKPPVKKYLHRFRRCGRVPLRHNMRIQEMRSGLPHLRKKVAAVRKENFFAAQIAKEAFIESLTEFIESDEPEAAVCEIEQPIWSVVSFDRVEVRNLTYSQAVKLVDELDAKHVAGLCIITDAAASKIAN
jgi:hypothetical protein